jgi:hypothetical protein
MRARLTVRWRINDWFSQFCGRYPQISVEASAPPTTALRKSLRHARTTGCGRSATVVFGGRDQRTYTSVCSPISSPSSTSIPRYLTVLSSFVCPTFLLIPAGAVPVDRGGVRA